MTDEKKRSILIVNSEPDMADLFAEMLLMDVNPYIVTTALNGKECLCGIKKNKPDIVLMDIELSDIGGWDLIEKIRANDPNMPVVVITSKTPGIDDMLRLSLVSDYLMIPVTLDGLHMAVKDAIEIPLLLEKCVKTFKGYTEKEDMAYLLYLLLKQNITDRKRFFLLRQLYPDRKLENDPENRNILDKLKNNIDAAQTEIKYFKNNGFLLA